VADADARLERDDPLDDVGGQTRIGQSAGELLGSEVDVLHLPLKNASEGGGRLRHADRSSPRDLVNRELLPGRSQEV
jgi:hypothetical protein